MYRAWGCLLQVSTISSNRFSSWSSEIEYWAMYLTIYVIALSAMFFDLSRMYKPLIDWFKTSSFYTSSIRQQSIF